MSTPIRVAAALASLALLAVAGGQAAAQQPGRPAPVPTVTPAPTIPLAPAAHVADTAAAVRLHLAEAVEQARRNAPQAITAQGQIESARIEQRAAYAAFLPSVQLGLGRSYQGGSVLSERGTTFPYSGRPWRSNESVNATLTLFDGGRRINDLRAARADIAAAEAGATTQEYGVTLSVTQAYFDALAAREALTAAQAQLALADTTLRIVSIRLAVRVVTRSDSLRAAVQLSQARVAVATALTQLANANATLTRLVGSSVPVTADPADTAAIVPALPDTATLRQLAEGGPAVRQATAQEEAAAYQRRAARSAYWPQIDASYSTTGNGFDPYFGLGSQYAYGNSFRVTLSLPILDQYQREQTFARARIAALDAAVSARDVRLGAREQLTQALSAMQLAAERIQEQALSVRASQEDLRVQLDRYRIGEATIIDVLTSESALTQAQSALIQARLDYRVARAQIEALTGRPL